MSPDVRQGCEIIEDQSVMWLVGIERYVRRH